MAGILLVTILKGQLTRENLIKSLKDTTKTTAMIMFMVASAMIFGRFIAISRLPFELANWVSALNIHPFLVMVFIILVYLVLGCFIDALALILLTVPIFYPVVVNVLGKIYMVWCDNCFGGGNGCYHTTGGHERFCR